MLLGNYSVFNRAPLKYMGGSTTSPEVNHAPNFYRGGRIRNRQYQDQNTAAYKLWATPTGYYQPYTWMMATKAGQLSSRYNLTGSSSFTATAQSGYNIDGTITGSGGVTNAPLGLIVSIAAAITGSGGVSSATAAALASLVASITGSSSVTATAAGLASLAAALTGAGTISAGNTALMNIAATIRGYSELTPEGIRDTVWNATASAYNTTGTMGQKLNSAASGGIDYDALADAVWNALSSTHNTAGSMGALLNSSGGAPTAADIWAYASRTLTANPGPSSATIATAVMTYAVETGWTMEQMMRILSAVLAGKVSGAGTTTETFRGINDDVNRVTATVDTNGNRTAITLNSA